MEESIIDARPCRALKIKVCFTLQEYEEAKLAEANGIELIFLDDPEFDRTDADGVLPVCRWVRPTATPSMGRWGRVIR